MSDKHLKIPLSRFEANRRLLLDIYVYLPRNNRFVRLRQVGQYFEPQILDNYRAKGHADFFVSGEGLSETDPDKIVLHDFNAPLVTPETERSGEDNSKPFEEGSILTKEEPEPPENVLEFPAKPEAKEEQATEEEEPAEEAQVVDIAEKRKPKPEKEPPKPREQNVMRSKKPEMSAEAAAQKKEKEEKRKEAQKKFFEDKMKAIRERQAQEKAEREKKEVLVAARKKREEEIKQATAAATELLEEVNVTGGQPEDDTEQHFKGNKEVEESQKVEGQLEIDNTKTKIEGKKQESDNSEQRFSKYQKPVEHRNILIKTEKLDDNLEKVKEVFLQKHKEGTLDSFELTRLDPELDKAVEQVIISNELGKKLVVLGMQLQTIREREHDTNALAHEDFEENKAFRARILSKVEQIEANLIRNKNGEKIDDELRSELNIDLIKEELVEAPKDGDDPLARVLSLTNKISEIKEGLAKTESLIEQKEITKSVSAASGGKTTTLERTLYSEAKAEPQKEQEFIFKQTLAEDDPLRQDFYQRLSSDDAMKESSDELAQKFKNNFINEISNYTAQIALAQGFRNADFLRELVIAALIYLRTDKEVAVKDDALPPFTKELLKRADTYENMDSTYVDSLQIISLVKEIINEEGFTSGAAKVDLKLLQPALNNAILKEDIFSLAFLEKTKQFVERGVKIHDAGYSFQLAREAILGLRKICSA